MSLSWYHKDTWTGALLHYNSFVPQSWKGLLKGYKQRIIKICNPDTIEDAINELIDVFEGNCYPQHFIKQNFIDFFLQKTLNVLKPLKSLSRYFYLKLMKKKLSFLKDD